MILIQNFKSLGFDEKDKYLYIIGHDDPAHVLGFTISSQRRHALHPYLGRECVHIPIGTLPALPKESWIQCFFEYHRLSVIELQARFEKFEVKHRGVLPPEYLKKVRRVVDASDVLKAYAIQDCLDAIDQDKSRLPAKENQDE